MAKKSKKSPSKKPAADLATQLKETVLSPPKVAKTPATTQISRPKAQVVKKPVVESRTPAPQKAALPKNVAAVGLTKIKTAFGFKQPSSLTPSALSTQNPQQMQWSLDPVRRVHAIVLAIVLLVGGGLFLFGDSLRSGYEGTVQKLSPAFDWRAWNAALFTKTNEIKEDRDPAAELLPSRDIVPSDSSASVIKTAVSPKDVEQGYADMLPKTVDEPVKKAQIKKDSNKANKSALNKKSTAKKKELRNKKTSNKTKVAGKSSKAKKPQ